MVAVPQRGVSPQEYLERERAAEYKSEYVNGEILAMAGATEQHNLITSNVNAELHTQFKRRSCKVYAQDMRVQVSETGMYTYPDVVAVCGEAQFEDAQRDTLLNPTVIVEVLSKSTEAYDRGDKFAHYRRLTSLQEVVLIAQDKARVERFVRQPDGDWLLSEANDLQETISLTSIDCTLALSEIYDKVEFSQEESAPPA